MFRHCMFVGTGLFHMTRVRILLIISLLLMKMWIALVMATESTVVPTEVPALVINVEQVYFFVFVHTLF